MKDNQDGYFVLCEQGSDIAVISDFYKCFESAAGITAVKVLTYNAEELHDKAPVIIMRTHISDTSSSKKFVIGVTSSNFGDLIIVDVVALDQGYHKHIIEKYLTAIYPNSFTNEFVRSADYLYQSYIMWSGGFYERNEHGLKLSGTSGDFGGDILGTTSAILGSWVLYECGINHSIPVESQEFEKKFIDFLLMNKLDKKFNYNLIEFIFKNFKKGFGESGTFIPMWSQPNAAMRNIQIRDRLYEDGEDHSNNMLSIQMEELTAGITRFSMLQAVVHNIKILKLEEEEDKAYYKKYFPEDI